MRWKVTLQFLAALLVVGVVINIVNTFVMSYYLYKFQKSDNIMSMSILAPKGVPLETVRLNGGIRIEDGKVDIDPETMEKINQNKIWVQFIDKEGKEIWSVNKPENIRTHYTAGEVIRIKDKREKIPDYDVFIKEPFEVPFNGAVPQYRYVVGVPEPEINLWTLLGGLFTYFIFWDEAKVISLGFTVLTALILGYVFANQLTRPVVKITDGITALAHGGSRENFSEKGLYREVYKSLNFLTGALQANEVERRRIEKMREEWIMNISHDLKTPLSSIKGYAEMIIEPSYTLEGEEIKKYSQVIMNKSNYMEVLLEDLKLTHKLKHDLIPLEKKEHNLVEVLRELVIQVLNDPKYGQRSIFFEPAEESIPTSFDLILLQRAVTNILYNALIHNPEDTVLWVRVWKKDKVCVEISDNGRGISEEDQKKLFDRYYRGTNTEQSGPGSGLGLAIAKQVIEAHGGCIELDSQPGEGTCIRILLLNS
jgi:signal transduction histidine kinase